MKKRIFKSMSLLAILSIILTSLVLSVFFSGEMYDAMKQQLRSEATYLAEAIESGGISYLQRVSVSNNTRITLISENGTVLFDNNIENESAAENHNQREEVQEARESGSGEAVRDSATIGQKTFYYALLLDNGQILRVSHTMHSLWLNIFSSLPYVLLFAVLVLLVALLLVHREVQRIVVPINELDLEHPVDNIVYDELSPLLQRISRQNMQISNQMKELAERQQEFSTLTENMNEGLVIVNAHGYILSINRRALQIFGLKEDDYLQKHILVVNRNLELKQTIENGLKGQNQELLLDLEGRKYQIMSNPILIAGHARGLVLLLLDVTEKQQQEQMRREFTANVSHELRTPMTAISGYAEIMMQGLVQPQDMKPFAEKIYKEANRLISLIADIIQLSQLDEGGSQFQMQQVALDMVMEEVEQRLQPLAEKKDVTLTMLAEPVTVQGNRQVLQEILYNLCENAIKYNKLQGTVQMSLQQLDGKAVVTVADTGIGIPVEEQQRVFERFYRVDKSHSRIIGGTGLGLSIVKHGVQMHHGEISMESELGEGTRIVVRLPLM